MNTTPAYVERLHTLVKTDRILQSGSEKISILKEALKYQIENNPIFQTYCEIMGFDPSDLRTSADTQMIPQFPTDVFKREQNGVPSPIPKALLTIPESDVKFYESSATGGNPSLVAMTNDDVKLMQRCYLNAFTIFHGSFKKDVGIIWMPNYKYFPNLQAGLVSSGLESLWSESNWILEFNPGTRQMDLNMKLAVQKLDEAESQKKSTLVGGSVPLTYWSLMKVFQLGKKWRLEDSILGSGAGGWDGRKGRITMNRIEYRAYVENMGEILGVSPSCITDVFATSESKPAFPGHFSEKFDAFIYHTPSAYADVFVRRPSDYEVLGSGEEGVLNIVTPLTYAQAGTASLVLDDWVKVVYEDECDECGRAGTVWRYIRRAPESHKTGCAAIALEKLSEMAASLI